MPDGMHSCAKHKYSTDATKSIPEQEDEWYQHLRDEEHEYKHTGKCENCGKRVHYESITAKVPQPTPLRKNPRAIIVFCDNSDKCRNEYLKKLGVK